MAMPRRNFIKIGAGAIGAAAVSGLWSDKLFAGSTSKPGVSLFENKFGVSQEDMRKLLEIALSKGGKFSELFFEYALESSVSMSEDIIKSSSETVRLGVGIRVLNGSQVGYAYTNELTFEQMKKAALTAGAIANAPSKIKVANLESKVFKNDFYTVNNVIAEEKLETKIELIRDAYKAALAYDKKITKVTASITDDIQYITIANSEGLIISDVRPQARLTVSANAEDKGVTSTGQHNAGGRVGIGFYRNMVMPATIGEGAAKEALELLVAQDAQAGEQPCVLSKDQSGVMIHEAVGHPLEGDSNWKKQSIMWDKMNQMVASPIVTIYDDATIPNYRGSLNIDDEGTITKNAMLIENGKLVGYLNDRIASEKLKMDMNGHGRRENYTCPPIPRMNNTILAKGDTPPEDIIKSVKKGFYAKTYQGGQVQGTGKFTFSVNLGYMIEDGKLTRPIKNATLIGTNVQILKEIEMVGNDMGFFLGSCGKDGQTQPVTAGTPTIKISKMTVGGKK